MPPLEDGVLTLATEAHVDVVRPMIRGFIRDCFPKSTEPEKIVEHSLLNIAKEMIYLWVNEEGVVVSMAASLGKVVHTTSVSWVYTPDEYRGQGYGSKVTASLSHKLITETHTICNLFTDATHPTSNSIYQKIGYQKIGEQSVYRAISRS